MLVLGLHQGRRNVARHAAACGYQAKDFHDRIKDSLLTVRLETVCEDILPMDDSVQQVGGLGREGNSSSVCVRFQSGVAHFPG